MKVLLACLLRASNARVIITNQVARFYGSRCSFLNVLNITDITTYYPICAVAVKTHVSHKEAHLDEIIAMK